MIVTELTKERSTRVRFAKDAQLEQAPRTYSFERAGRLWTPKARRETLQAWGSGPCGPFGPRGAGGGDDLWQPTTVSGYSLDINPRFQLTTGLDGARVTCASVINNVSGASDSFANGNSSLQPTYEPVGWGGSYVRPAIRGNGSSYYLTCSSALPSSFTGGTNTAFWLFMAGQFVSLPAASVLSNPFFLGRTTSTNPLWDFSINASGVYQVFKRSDAGGGGAFQSGGTPNTAKHITSIVTTSTPDVTMRLDTTSASNVFTGALSAGGTLTINVAALFATYANSTPGNWADYRLGRLIAGTGALTNADHDYIMASLQTLYL